jgi:hypothetical protein
MDTPYADLKAVVLVRETRKGIAVGSKWQHQSGNIYMVYEFTNADYTNVPEDRQPKRISYINIIDGRKYSRNFEYWHHSMTEIKA